MLVESSMKSRTYTVSAVATIVPVIIITRKSERSVVAMIVISFLNIFMPLLVFFFGFLG